MPSRIGVATVLVLHGDEGLIRTVLAVADLTRDAGLAVRVTQAEITLDDQRVEKLSGPADVGRV
jgi:hypothetical protein